MPTDPFRAIAALARAEATRTTPEPRKPADAVECTDTGCSDRTECDESTAATAFAERDESAGSATSAEPTEPTDLTESEPAATAGRRAAVWNGIARRIRRPNST
jgi:hypothetical protein